MDLPRLAPVLWESLRGPADDEVREALRAAVEPMPLPDELDVFLRAHDGQSIGAGWWPTLDSGPLLSGQQIAEEVTWFRSNGEPWQWSVAWIPVTHEQWYQAVIDAVPERSGTVIDASWPDLPRAMAPSFTHAVDGVIDSGRAGLLPTADDDRAKRLERTGPRGSDAAGSAPTLARAVDRPSRRPRRSPPGAPGWIRTRRVRGSRRGAHRPAPVPTARGEGSADRRSCYKGDAGHSGRTSPLGDRGPAGPRRSRPSSLDAVDRGCVLKPARSAGDECR